MQAIRTCLSRYATFSGRASRPEFWFFALFVLLGNTVAGIADAALFGMAALTVGPRSASAAAASGPLSTVFGLAVLVPFLAAGWRRMHDTGRSGLHLLYPVIVFFGITSFFGFTIGFESLLQAAPGTVGGLLALILGLSMIVLILSPLIVLWWLLRPSDSGANRYGAHPSEVPT